MVHYNGQKLEDYLRDDWILQMLTECEEPGDDAFRTHQWLKEMDNKRMIYADLYGDLLRGETGRRVLDVGGGYTSLTRRLMRKQDYELVDIMAHGLLHLPEIFQKENGKLAIQDWREYNSRGGGAV